MKIRYIPILGGVIAAVVMVAVVKFAPYMPTQADLAPEETALLVEWTKVGDALSVQRMLEQGACVEAVSAEGTSALMLAAGDGSLEVAKVLLSHNAKVNAVNALGDTPLHFAVRQNQRDVVSLLLENGAAVDARNKEGVTPLMVAAWSGFDNLVQMLLSAGADTEIVDDEGCNAASHARDVHDPAAREVILKLLGA